VRGGSIARLRDALDGTEPTFLLDASVFPGNSGGPAVFRPEVTAITGTEAISRSFLLGVIAAYVPYIDVAISGQTKRPRITFEENSGLAEVYPVDFIDETIIEWRQRVRDEQPPETPETAADPS
jgi:hypothetical protein